MAALAQGETLHHVEGLETARDVGEVSPGPETARPVAHRATAGPSERRGGKTWGPATRRTLKGKAMIPPATRRASPFLFHPHENEPPATWAASRIVRHAPLLQPPLPPQPVPELRIDLGPVTLSGGGSAR